MNRPSLSNLSYRIALTISLTLLFWSSLLILKNSTVKSAELPISEPTLWPQTSALRAVESAFINAVPGADGTEIFVSVSGVTGGASPLFLSVDPGSGGGNHKGGYAMTLSGTTYLATAIGFAPGEDVGSDGDDTMNITTTVGSQVVGTGEINFQRAFVETGQSETISVDNGAFELEFLNTNSFQSDTYVLVMSTNAPPGPLPFGYRLVGNSYNLRPSGSLTQSQKLMTLNMTYLEPLPGGSDPHSLTIMRWDVLAGVWREVGGTLFTDSNLVTLATKTFGIYALATAPLWRDAFSELTLSGVSDQVNTVRGPGGAIILDNAASGSVTSIPITPTGADQWGTLTFSATLPASTTLTVDVLDAANNVVLAAVSSGTDLAVAGVDLTTHPSLKLRANLSAASPPDTPELHAWELTWGVEVHQIYLPVVLK
ncbi:MAG: hypothetical protein KDF65_04525 [Anaerolineae bacterium]|nr:hypothetical protein [Anaerolineae bacterium]